MAIKLARVILPAAVVQDTASLPPSPSKLLLNRFFVGKFSSQSLKLEKFLLVANLPFESITRVHSGSYIFQPYYRLRIHVTCVRLRFSVGIVLQQQILVEFFRSQIIDLCTVFLPDAIRSGLLINHGSV